MARINWKAVLIVIFLILLLAYRRPISEAVRELRLGELWQEFCGIIWAMPSLGRFALVAMVLALLYVTVYFLILNRIRR